MNDRRLRTLVLASFLLLVHVVPGLSQWRKVSVAPGIFFNEVFFIDNNHGWLTQHLGIVTRTTDGGNTWSTASLPSATGSFNRDICFVSTLIGFVSGDDGIWKTTDGGVTWTNITPPGPVTGNSSNWFIDANNGVYGFGGCNLDTVRFFRTSNGGVTWDSVKYGHPTDVAVGGICYSGGAYFAAGGVGKIWKSTDAGANWTYGTTGSAGFHEDAVAAIGGAIHLASVDGSVCGISGSSKMVRSTDAGATWRLVNFPGVVMWGVTMYSPTDGWCCADNAHAWQTTDGGTTWVEHSCGLNRLDRVDDICFTDATHGWAVGDAVYKYVGDGWASRPDTINFGDIIVGQNSADSNAIVTALGSTLAISNRVLVGTDAVDFQTPFGLGPQSVLGCADGPTPVRFRPLSEGVKIARIEYTLVGFPETPIVYLKGRGVKPRIEADPVLLFDTLLCDTKKVDTLMVRNRGTAPLRITAANMSGPAATSFQLLQPTLPATILPGDSMRFFVQLTTGSYGALGGSISLTSNDLDSGKAPLVVPIKAYRRQISFGFQPDSLVIIPPAPFGIRATVCVTYLNIGDGLQVLDSVLPQGGDVIIRQEPSAFAAAVVKGGRQYICFSATASDTALHVRRFRVRTQPCAVDTFITVVYRASNPIINSATSLTLVSGACDTVSYDTVRIANTGNAPLIVQEPQLSGTDAAVFSLVAPTTWPDTIPVGGSLRVVIRSILKPGVGGTRSASILFPNNDGLPGKNKWTVQLTAQQGSSDLSLNGRRLDAGDICLNDTSHTVVLTLRNAGTAPAVVRSVTTGDTTAPLVVRQTASLVAPGISDSIVFAVVATAPGAFRAQYVVRYDPCDRRDTVEISGRIIGVGMSAVPPALDYGSAQVNKPVRRDFTLTNTGTGNTTLTSWLFDPPVASARVVSPALPLALGPGQQILVTVEMQAADTGAYRTMLNAIADAPCPDTLRSPIAIYGIKGAVLTNRLAVDIGSRVACGTEQYADSLVLTNSGSDPIDLTALALASGNAFTIVSPAATPISLAPGNSVTIHVALTPTAQGAVADTLLVTLAQPEQPLLKIPLAATISRARLSITDTGGIAVTAVSFDTLTSCTNTSRRMVRLHNGGSAIDTLLVSVDAPPFALGAPASIILAPGADTVVTVDVTMSAPGTAAGTLLVRWAPCDRTDSVNLYATYRVATAAIADVSFLPTPIGDSAEMVTILQNTGTVGEVLDDVIVENPAAGFTVVGSYAGTFLAPGDGLPVTVRFKPNDAQATATRVLALLRSPCRDTVYAAAEGSGTRDQIDTVVAGVPGTRGRWGTSVAVPVSFDNHRGAGFSSMEITLTAAPKLLDPRGVWFARPDIAPGWSVVMAGYDAAAGALRLRLTSDGTAAPLPSGDTLLLVEYRVLRGSEINSEIKVQLSGLPTNIVSFTNAGSFALEDYCDAYGRLLQLTGNVALDQNVPNPFNPETIIEFETAFKGPVLLVVYDGLGNEVARPIDEELPAGRRRVRFDARALASGVYTYKLVTGLQVLMRRMVVTK